MSETNHAYYLRLAAVCGKNNDFTPTVYRRVIEAAAAFEALQSENKSLREALEPFAKAASSLENLYTYEVPLIIDEWSEADAEHDRRLLEKLSIRCPEFLKHPDLIVGDFSRARAALHREAAEHE